MGKKILVLLSLLAMMPLATAADLIELYNIALQKDPGLQIAASTRQSQETLKPQALAALLPQVKGRIRNINSMAEPETPLIDLHTETHDVTVSLEQALLNFQAWYAYQVANRQVDAAQADYVAAQQDLMIRVTEAYFDVLKSKDIVHFKTAQKLALEKELEQVQQRLNVGLVAITDLHETKARYDNAVADEIQEKNLLADTIEALEEITGQGAEVAHELKENLLLSLPFPADVELWVNSALENNPRLQSSRFALQAAASTVKVRKAAHLPSLTFSGSRGRNRDGTFSTSDSIWYDNWSGNLQLDVELFAGGATLAKARQAEYDYETARQSLERSKRTTKSAASRAYRGVVTSMSRAEALKQAVISSRTALKAAKAAYEVGSRTSVDVLDSISDLYENEQQYAESRHTYVVTQLKLKQAAGTLTVTDLQEVNALLQPAGKKEFQSV